MYKKVCRHEVLKAYSVIFNACKSVRKYNGGTCKGCYIKHACFSMCSDYEFHYCSIHNDLFHTEHSVERVMDIQEMKDNLYFIYDCIMAGDYDRLYLS